MAPHVGEELWAKLGGEGLAADAAWPQFDPAVAAEPAMTLVIQVAGKVRDRATVPVGTTEAAALEVAMRSDKVRAALDGRGPSKVVYVQDRLINLVP
jgi:leucyl-tRNA synthetase